MPLDLAWFAQIDWTWPHAAVTLLCAVASLWLMQHLTSQACFATGVGRGLMLLRLSLALLTLVLALNCYLTVKYDVEPWWPDTLFRVLLLFALMTVPVVLPRHLRHPARD